MGVRIDTLKCTGCEACVPICPAGALEVVDMKCRVSDACTSCGQCVEVCQWRAITLEDEPDKKRDNRN